MGYAARQNAAAKAAEKRHTTAFQGVGADGRKASRRPRGHGSRAVRLNLALSEEELALYRERARTAGMSLSYWIVSAANAYAGIAMPEPETGLGNDAPVSHVLAEDESGQIYLTDAERPQSASTDARQTSGGAQQQSSDPLRP